MKDPLPVLPGYILRRAANAATAKLADRLAAVDLRQVEASTLILIDRNPGITSGQLGEILGIKSANMATLMSRIDSAGLIERRQIDGRTQATHLTQHGVDVLHQARSIIDAFEAEMIEAVPEELRPGLLPALTAVWQWAQEDRRK